MADPFSVAGTAVGITSLGIQTCQILYNYYSQLKGYRDDIDNVLQQVQGLQGILESVREVKARFEIDDHAPSSQLQLALEACQKALGELKKMADKCNTSQQSGSIQSRIKDVKKRVLWPYKKDTLEGMQATLSRFQENLSLALQSAGLDVVLRKVDSIHPLLHTIQQQATSVEQSLLQNTGSLHLLQNSMIDVSLVQQQHTRLMSSEFLAYALNSIAKPQRPSRYSIYYDGAIRHPSTTPPSLLAEATQILEDVIPRAQTTIQTYDTTATLNSSSVCDCRKKTRRSMRRAGWIPIVSEETYLHKQDCPFFPHSDYSRSIATQVTVCSRFVGFCVQAGWRNSRGGGWNTIAPVLRYRAVVSDDSPAFKTLRYAIDKARALRSHSKHALANLSTASNILATTSISLQRSFGKNASPSDLDRNGNGIFSAVIELLIQLMEFGFADTGAMCAFIDTCVAHNIPCNENDARGLTPIEQWQWDAQYRIGISGSEFRNSCTEVFHHLIRKSDNWSVWTPPNFERRFYRPALVEMITDVTRLEYVDSRLDEDNPLLRAIYRNSLVEFRHCMADYDPQRLLISLNEHKYLYYLSAWPEGLQMVTTSGLIDATSSLTRNIWKAVLIIGEIEQLELLLQFGVQVTLEDWYTILYGWQIYDAYNRIAALKLSNVLDTMATQLVPYSVSPSTQSFRVHHDDIGTLLEDPPLFSTRYLSVLAAESAWAAGCRNLGSNEWLDGSTATDGTRPRKPPLWVILTSLPSSYSGWIWPVSKWLLDHGANVAWIHPVYLTTPAHLLARRAILATYPASSLKELADVRGLLSTSEPDRCDCLCSEGGCHVIGVAVQESIRVPTYQHSHSPYARAVQSYVFSHVENHQDTSWMSSAILRVMTFEKLALTHTCCYRVLDEVNAFFKRPKPEEAKEIRDLERDDIDLLNTLVADFEAKWATYRKPFVTFMNRVWKPRMRAVRKARQFDKLSYQAELRRVGVDLKESNDQHDDKDSEGELDWPDVTQDREADGWYTTDEEDANEMEDEEEGAEVVAQLGGGQERELTDHETE